MPLYVALLAVMLGLLSACSDATRELAVAYIRALPDDTVTLTPQQAALAKAHCLFLQALAERYEVPGDVLEQCAAAIEEAAD